MTGTGEQPGDARQRLRDAFIDDHRSFSLGRSVDEPSALVDLRRAGLERFASTGLPSTRDEEWRFTDIAPILAHRFGRPEPNGARGDLGTVPVPRWSPSGAHVLTLTDGRHTAGPARVGGLSAGAPASTAKALGLADALRRHADSVLPHLGRTTVTAVSPFAALADAFLSDGAFIHVPAGVVVEEPFHIVYRSTGETDSRPSVAKPVSASFPRALVILEEGARATVVESFHGATGGPYLACPVTDVWLGADAVLDHYRIQEDGPLAYHMAALRLRQGDRSTLRSLCVTLGARLSRLELAADLAGHDVSCTLNGLYLADGQQHVDSHLLVDHAGQRGRSEETYKGVLDGRSRAVFNGRIRVHPHAQQTDARQTNRNLLLSNDCRVNSNPQLEILNDDVKCTHGSTVGQLDQDALFYLQSRGIDREAARTMLVRAFAGDLLSGIAIGALREHLEATLAARIGAADGARPGSGMPEPG